MVTVDSLDVLLFLFGTRLLFLSSSNCCFLTCTQVSQEAGLVAWYSHLFQNFSQFIAIHIVKGFGIVNKAEIDVFWNCLTILMIQWMLSIWSLIPVPFLKPAWTSESSRFMYCWSLAWRILTQKGLIENSFYLLGFWILNFKQFSRLPVILFVFVG